MPKILLIRHGESQSNIGLPNLSFKSAELTAKGKRQARDIAQRLRSDSPDLIVTSSFQRARKTALQTKQVFPFVPEEVWPVHEFTYLYSRSNEYSTVEDRKPVVDVFWEIADPKLIDGPGTESFEQFIRRVRDVKRRLEAGPWGTVAVFSHEQFICAFRWLMERDPVKLSEETMKAFRRYVKAHPIQNGEIVPIELRAPEEQRTRELVGADA